MNLIEFKEVCNGFMKFRVWYPITSIIQLVQSHQLIVDGEFLSDRDIKQLLDDGEKDHFFTFSRLVYGKKNDKSYHLYQINSEEQVEELRALAEIREREERRKRLALEEARRQQEIYENQRKEVLAKLDKLINKHINDTEMTTLYTYKKLRTLVASNYTIVNLSYTSIYKDVRKFISEERYYGNLDRYCTLGLIERIRETRKYQIKDMTKFLDTDFDSCN